MPNYEKMYSTLFNAATDALRLMERGQIMEAMAVLIDAQCKTEEMYIDSE